MATPPRRSGSDAPAGPVPFSYAQAAKGLSSTGAAATATPPTKPSSGTITPSKEANPPPAPSSVGQVMNWADDAEVEEPLEKQQSAREGRTTNGVPPPSKSFNTSHPATSSISSPDLGASTSSTVTKDDDVASLQNQSSESTWENKSQASTSVDKSAEPAERTSDKVKSKEVERSPFKPLQDAPVPVVNIWKQRAEEAKAKAAQKAGNAKAAPPVSAPAIPNGLPQGSAPAVTKKSKASSGAVDAKESVSAVESKQKARDEEKPSQFKKESKPDAELEKARKGSKGKPGEKDAKSTPANLPLPPDRDQESWPTPDTAVDEDRKKAHGKTEKVEKERKDSSNSRPHGKQEWVSVPYTPTVVFNTPLPNTATSRRGGRGGGRGGAQTGGRNGGYGPGGASASDKEHPAPSALPNGDHPKRGRSDGPAARDTSPTKGRRAASASSVSTKDVKTSTPSGEKLSKASVAAELEPTNKKGAATTESAPSSGVSAQNNTFPRQYTSNRPPKGRRGDALGPTDRRKDSDLGSPSKEGTNSFDRRASTATQTETPEDAERRSSAFHDNSNGASKGGPNERRPFGSFSGRDRPRGGRGPRGNYSNGHQFTNGHAPPLQSSSTFPLRSPTTFQPEQNAFFPPPPGPGRSFRGNPRSQSVTGENMYNRMPGYPGSPIPPIQTYGMYDYPMMQPMSAVPYSPFGVDQYTLFSMVATQLEYYFSVENLCKDIFLRKHMDSKGFVYLSVIAEFNRIKQLTTDMELIKLVCFQSRIIEFRVGVDGKDRLRRREGWEQWVLNMSERDPSAQNDGLEELHNPPTPHPNGFDNSGMPRHMEMPSGSPTGPPPFLNEGPYPPMNGTHAGVPHSHSMAPMDNLPNGHVAESAPGSITPNGHPVDTSSRAVSGETDSFSDEQVETLSVIVRKQDQAQPPNLPPSAMRTFSNGSIDSRSGVPDEGEKSSTRQSSLKVNGTGPSLGVESKVQDKPRRTSSPFAPNSASSIPPVRLYWVKGKDAPVESLPADSTYESYTQLRAKALDQRHNALPSTCPYDMDVLYQFWSHFLIRNFNTRMYDEFRHFAFEDASQNASDVGLRNLIKYYGESLLSPQSLIRERVARHYVDLVKQENENQRPAFRQLRSALRNGALDPRNRKRIIDFLDKDLKISLEQ